MTYKRPASEPSRPLTILNVAYPLLPVHSGSAGGAEQILHLLDRGLAEAGHRSLVMAAAGSQTCGLLIQTAVANGQISDTVREGAQIEHRRRIREVLDRYKVDLIHFHGLDFLSYLPDSGIPKLATLHLPIPWYPARIFETKELSLNCVSYAQAGTAPAEIAVPVVENGIDVEAFSPAAAERTGLLWLGRICPEKGVDIALRAAHRVGRALTIAGPVHPFETHQTYFREVVEPLLDAERRYLGPVALSQKRDLLSRADCVLIPSLAAETSSLVAMEAAASGTPVVGFATGALPEVIENGKTGFLVQNEEEMADAVRRAHTIPSEVCRQEAVRRFCFRSMVARYLQLYEEILSPRRKTS
jgi:glycosyltransferase involved in cell wall biosynthesis